MLFHSVKPDRRAHRCVRAFSICLGLCLAAVGHAAVTIDPDAIGATDVTPADIESNPLQTAIDLTVGDASTGALRIDAGSKVRNNVIVLGNDASSVGMATVTGADSRLTYNETLYVGYSGDGTLRVEDRATVTGYYGRIGQEAGSTGVATVTGAGSGWGSTYTLTVGYTGDGELNIEDGGLVYAPNGWIAYESGSTGVATVTGAGSAWNGRAALYVGYGGAGSLMIKEGGRVQYDHRGLIGYLAGSTGEVTVSGVGSTWIIRRDTFVGDGGAGSLIVRDGGAVSTEITALIGNKIGSIGRALVTGAGSSWNISSTLHVGNYGDGALRIEDGGVVNSSTSSIGAVLGSSGAVTITGAGSQWNLGSRGLSVGVRDDGTLRVEAGGEVNNFTASIGTQAGSKGVATVTGAGSRWNSAEFLSVGNFGDGTLRVDDGGAVASRVSYIGGYTGAVGEAVVTGALSKWTLDQLSVGRSASGKLRVEAGGLVDADEAWIGALAGSTGEALVTGAGSHWTVGDSLQVGAQSDGTLRVEAGGVVTSAEGGVGYSPGSTGVATVTGVGSQWNNSGDLQVGVSSDADGVLRVEAGGVVANYRGYLGSSAGSIGAATITGAGSRWDNASAFYAGLSGDGSLLIENGGVVTCTSFSYLGRNAGSTGAATVTGAGSQWNNAGSLFIGSLGEGALLVEEGGVVTSSSGFIAQDSESSGAVTITGAGSRWTNTTQLAVGGGTLRVEAGGVVASQVGIIGTSFDATGAVTVTGAGSQWNNSVDLYVGGSPIGARYGATLDILDQGFVSVAGTTKLWAEGSVTLADGGVLRTERLDLTVGAFEMLSGGRLEADAVVGDLVNLSGVVAPGVDPGVMTVSGDYDQAANAALEIELGGVEADQFDAIAIAGEATLDGTLEVALLNSFTPSAGDLFTVLDSGVVNGAFATVDFTAASLPAGLEWRVDYYADRVDLLVIDPTQTLAGDYNSDGVVNAADYTVWRDGNSVDSSQSGHDLWADNYGASTATATSNAASQAVPEPASVITMLLACLGLMARRSAAVETASRPR